MIQSIEMGLGPLYNAQSCAECHQDPATGGNSQISQLRVGILDGGRFSEPLGGLLIHDRSIEASIQAHVPAKANVHTLRIAPGTLGDGYVEVIADETLIALAREQPGRSGGLIHGDAIMVDVVEAPGTRHVGRFGWKDQHSSLLSSIAEAAVDELGITSSLSLDERTSNGRSVTRFDEVRNREGRGVVLYATQFVRSTNAPPRDAAIAETPSSQAGAALFETLGCGICHVASVTTAPAGTIINGGRYQVPPALGAKTIHPYSDYLLHAVGTGDGIVQNGGQATRQKLRTAPLWGLRTRNRLLHDGSALTLEQAILRHRGEATALTREFRDLSDGKKRNLLRFLNSR